MGLLKILRKIKRKEKEMRLLMLGLDNAGKTTVLKAYLGEDLSSISPTLGFNICTLSYERYKVNIWDVGGQTTIRSYWRNYFEQTDGLIFVIDSADRSRLDQVKSELLKLLQQEKLAGASLLILANKQDMSGAVSQSQLEDALDLKLISTQGRHWHIEACSAMTNQKGLKEGIEWIVNDIAARIYMLD